MALKQWFKQYRLAYTGLPRAAWLLALVVFINRSGMMVLFFISLYLTRKLGFSVELAGHMISVYGLGSLAGAFLGGWLTDRWGTGRVQFLSLFFGGISFLIIPLAETALSIGVALFIAASINDSFRPASISAFAEVCPPHMRARSIALNRLAANVGVAIGPAVGGYLAMINYDLIFWADGFTCFAASGLFWILFLRKKRSYHPDQKNNINSRYRSPYRDGFFLSIIGLLLITGILFVQVFSTWPLYLREAYRLIENQIGSLLAINAVIIGLVEMPLIHRLERYNPLKVVTLGALLLFAGFAALPIGDSYHFAIVTVIIWTLGEILVFPLVGGIVANRSDDRNRGRYMGLFSFTFGLSFVLGPALGSYIYVQWGPDYLWYAFAAAAIFVCGGFWYLQRFHRTGMAYND